MERKKIAFSKLIRSKYLFLISISLTALMVISAIYEMHRSKKEFLDLLEKQAHILAESFNAASQNTLASNLLVEQLIEERLLAHAAHLKFLFESGKISNSFLAEYAAENNLFRINIFSRDGERQYVSFRGERGQGGPAREMHENLIPIFSGDQDTVVIGLRQARFQTGFRYAVALATSDNGAIVVNMNAEELLDFRKEIGYGGLLNSIAQNESILYAVLQDSSGILAASANVVKINVIDDSPELKDAYENRTLISYLTEFENDHVLEVVHPLMIEEELIGIVRLGLSLKPLESINSRVYGRIIIISIITLFFVILLFIIIVAQQNLEIISKQYKEVETYSQNIIQNVNDAIIVYEQDLGIKIFNLAAEKLFRIKADQVYQKKLDNIFTESNCREIFRQNITMQEISCRIADEEKYLIISKNKYSDLNGKEVIVLVIRDLTRQKRLEQQIQLRERLSAMGQLASGVAHEIRNPLNAIATIIQQLSRDFLPKENREEYQNLADIVRNEVKRINETIRNFLKFAKPEPLKFQRFNLKEFFETIQLQYKGLIEEHNLQFSLRLNWNGEVEWDRHKLLQVFANLMQNSIDVLDRNGQIEIGIQQQNNNITIRFSDNGPGIPAEIRAKIFNLYFTTKAKGTGIGLSIVQRIIDQHNGTISLEESSSGCRFRITVPRIAKNKLS